MTHEDRKKLDEMLQSGTLQARTEHTIALAEAYARAGLAGRHIAEFVKHQKRALEVLEDFRQMLRMGRKGLGQQEHPELALFREGSE